MKDPSPATAGTVKPKRLVIDVRRLRERLGRITAQPYYYDPVLNELATHARDCVPAIERGTRGALKTGSEIVRAWDRRERELVREREEAKRVFYLGYSSEPAPTPTPAAARRPAKPRTISLPRARSREMSHAPRRSARSTPKTASRSGDSGDSDPAGPSPAPRWRRFTVDEHFLVVELVA